MDTKTCTHCRVSLPLVEFGTHQRDGYRSNCRFCVQLAKAEHRWRNPERARKEKLQEYSRKRAKNAVKKALRDAGRPPLQVRQRLNSAAWRAAKLRATPKWVDHEKISEFYFAADFLGMVTGEWHQVDHVIPLRSKLVCGLHVQNNMQVLTRYDNYAKGNRHWPDMP